jgi:hypothetical protein
MPISWPVEIPEKHAVGIVEETPGEIMRTEMDQGPAKVRRKFTAVPRYIRMTLLLTGEQRQSFNSWWENLWLQSGDDAGKYTGRDPLTGGSVTYRVMNTARPRWTARYAGTSNAKVRWEGELQVEILP